MQFVFDIIHDFDDGYGNAETNWRWSLWVDQTGGEGCRPEVAKSKVDICRFNFEVEQTVKGSG